MVQALTIHLYYPMQDDPILSWRHIRYIPEVLQAIKNGENVVTYEEYQIEK